MTHPGTDLPQDAPNGERDDTLTVFHGGTVVIAADRDGVPVTTTALAVRAGRVYAHGDAALALRGSADEVIDLAGGALTPGIGEGHAHPVLGALEAQGPEIRTAKDLDGILAAVRDWKAAHPDAAWIVGASYDATFAPGGHFDARWLDEVTGDTPTVLRSWDYHTVWVNSAALRAAGYTAETPDPPLGRIVRRDDAGSFGTPLGTLQESAANDLLANVVPPFDVAARVAAIEAATAMYAAQGTTWVQDAWVDPADVEPYLAAAAQQRLRVRVNLAQRVDPQLWRDQVTRFPEVRERVAAAGNDRLTAHTVKFFVDGVVESHTAAMLDPYTDRPDEQGLPNWDAESLIAAVSAFDALGFQVHLHAIGDRANRMALDAIEAAVSADRSRERHHVVAHISVLHPDDVARFASLDVIACFQPYWAQCDAVMQTLTIPHIGEDRESWQYLIGSVHRSGATVAFGSDWPVTTPDWRVALATAVDRRDVTDPASQPWLPAERVSPATAFAGYTQAFARLAQAPDRGTLDIGHVADLAWLDRNPIEIDAAAIPEIRVQGTWIAGSRVFSVD